MARRPHRMRLCRNHFRPPRDQYQGPNAPRPLQQFLRLQGHMHCSGLYHRNRVHKTPRNWLKSQNLPVQHLHIGIPRQNCIYVIDDLLTQHVVLDICNFHCIRAIVWHQSRITEKENNSTFRKHQTKHPASTLTATTTDSRATIYDNTRPVTAARRPTLVCSMKDVPRPNDGPTPLS